MGHPGSGRSFSRVDGATVAFVATTVQIRYLPCRVLVASLTG
jgi:hypothetical protein